MLKRSACALLLFSALAPAALMPVARAAASPASSDHAVILLYHHVDGSTPASTSVTPERFGEHLDWLAENDYQVLDLLDVLRSLRDGEPVPDHAVAVTFDDAWISVHETAAPMLAERGWPFTVFVNTDAVDSSEGPVMSWDQIRAVMEQGGQLGSHSASHGHLPARGSRETESDWVERIDRDLERAASRIEEETGRRPELFAYPYGEDSSALADRVADLHEFALVQRSGAVGHGSDFLAIPRFPLAAGFDGLERFERAVRARPLPVERVEVIPEGEGVRTEPVDAVELSLGPGAFRAGALGCFSAAGESLALDRPVDSSDRIIRVTIGGRDRSGRNKINCTAPASDGSGDFYWYSYQWLRPPLE